MSTWQPTATVETLKQRAAIIDKIRYFFKERGVLEVTTPILSQSTVTDPHLESFQTWYNLSDNTSQAMYLQTSPEFAMKRLVAAGSGSIYQITPAFRNQGEQGRWHNPEFTLLEWYRIDFNLQDLINETRDLLQLILKDFAIKQLTYSQLFDQYLDCDPHQINLEQIQTMLAKLDIVLQPTNWLKDRDTGLQLLVDYLVQHYIEPNCLLFLYDFPISQAGLSRIRNVHQPVAERVEVYYQNLELANGFYELADAKEQKKRFLKDLAVRKQQKLKITPFDQNLLDALSHGLPDCSGIALGLDRLVALATHSHSLADVLSFPITRA